MKRILSCLLGIGAAFAVCAEETTNVDYGQTSGTATMELTWVFKTDTFNEQTCAVITGVKNVNGTATTATIIGDVSVPQSVTVTNSDGNAVGYVVKKIAADTFKNQIGITSITIPSTVEDISAPFCSGCTLLSSIQVDASNPWYTSFNGMLFDKDKEKLIACPATLDTIDLPSTVTTIGQYAFSGCFRVKSLSLPASVTTISSHTFDGCKKLKTITFTGDEPDSVDGTAFSDISATGYIPKDATWSVTPPTDWRGLSLEYSSGAIVSGIASDDSGNVTWYYRVVDGQAELYNNGQSCIGTGTSQTYTFDTDSAKWIGDGELKIPSSLGGYPVTKIGDNAFKNCSALSTVTISESITEIGAYAFRNCSGIKSLTIPSSVKSIGSHPFEGTSMTALALPDSLRELDGNPMAGCDTMLSVSIASDNSYYTVANGLLYDKDVALLVGCPARQEGAALATTCTAIGPEAFYGCFRISSMIIPEYVVTIGDSAFNNMSRLASIVFPASVTTLEGAALFSGCTAITYVGFSGNAPTHDDDLFLGTPTDMKVYVSQGTKGWDGDSASTALPASGKWPVDGDNGRTIENREVSAEADLKEGDIFTVIVTNGTSSTTWTLKVLANKGVEILAMSPKPTDSFTVPSTFDSVLGTLTVKSIGSKLCANATGLTSVSIPNTVTNIGDEVFLNCDILSSVTLGSGLRNIGRHVFSGTIVQTISIPDNVNSIGGNILAGCNPSTSISISDNNQYFAISSEKALYDKDFTTLFAVPTTVEEISIPKTVTDFAEECFLDCMRLKKVSFLGDAPTAADGDDLYLDVHSSMTNFVSAGNTTFGTLPGTWHLRPVVSDGEVPVEDDGEFKYRIVDNSYAEIYNNGSAAIDTTKSGTITVPDTLGDYPVKKIGAGAFSNCVNITSVSIPATVTEIGDYAFYGCEMLEEIELPSALTTIGKQPFYGTGLTSLELPAKVQNLDGNPVAGCELIASITVADGSRYLVAEDGLLYNKKQTILYACQAYAEEITIPETVTEIASDALSRCYDMTAVNFEGDAPTCDDDLYVDCPDVVSYASEDATGFTTGTWKDRPISTTGGGTGSDPVGRQQYTDGDGNTWLYTVEGGKVKLGYWGETPVLENADSATVITIPESIDGYPLTTIPDNAFESCPNVVTIEIPSTITSIGEGAFNGCNSLEEFKVSASNQKYKSKYGVLYTKDGTTIVKVPAKFDFNWSLVQTTTSAEKTWQVISQYFTQEDSTMVLHPAVTNVLSSGSPTTSVASSNHVAKISQDQLFSGVTAIANYAFTDCGEVELPEATRTVTSINAVATVIGDNTAIEETVLDATTSNELYEPLKIPSTVTSIGQYATYGSHFTEIGDESTATFYTLGSENTDDDSPGESGLDSNKVSSGFTTTAKSEYAGWVSVGGTPTGFVTLKTSSKNKLSGSLIPLGGKKAKIKSVEQLLQYGDVFLGDVFFGYEGKVWSAAFATIDNGGEHLLDGLTTLSMTVKSKGSVSVSGYAGDGTKISTTTKLVKIDDSVYLPLTIQLYTGKKGGFSVLFKIADGKPSVISNSSLIRKSAVAQIAPVTTGSPSAFNIGKPVFELPTGYAYAENATWKPRYNKKTGVITASYKVIANGKKKSVKIYGVSIDGIGHATTVIPKVTSMATAFAE